MHLSQNENIIRFQINLINVSASIMLSCLKDESKNFALLNERFFFSLENRRDFALNVSLFLLAL